LWSSVVLVAVGAVVFIVWLSHATNEARIQQANERVAKAVAAAQNWIARGDAAAAESIENELTSATASEDATNKSDGAAVLEKTRAQRERLAEEARVQEGQHRAEKLFGDAKQQLENGKISETIQLLKHYVADPYALRKSDAEILISEAEAAISESKAFQTLVGLSDPQYALFLKNHELNDGVITHPVLQKARNSTLSAVAAQQLTQVTDERQRLMVAAEKKEAIERQAAATRTLREEQNRRSKALQAAGLTIIEEDSWTSIGQLLNGEKSGIWVSFKNGKLVSSSDYVDGKEEGVRISYKDDKPTAFIESQGGQSHGYYWNLPKDKHPQGITMQYAYGRSVDDSTYAGAPPGTQKNRLLAEHRRHLEAVKQVAAFIAP
jgi:hypothetical protein